MDFEALVGRAAQFSDDAILIIRNRTAVSADYDILYANPAFRASIACARPCDGTCCCHVSLSEPDFTQQSLLTLIDHDKITKSFRVTVTALPEKECGEKDCFMLVGRPSGAGLAEGRERLYSDIARKFIELPGDEAVKAAVRAAGLYFDVDRCFAARMELSSGKMDVRHAWRKGGSMASLAKSVKKVRDTMCSWVQGRLRQGEVVQVNDLDALPEEAAELYEVLENSGAKAAVLAPVLIGRNSMWFIGMHCQRQSRDWSEEDVATFKVVGDLLGNAFTQTETIWSLKETERRFSDVGANIPGVVYQMRQNTQGKLSFSYISQGIRDLAGWGPASMMSQPELLEQLIIREDRGRYRETMTRAGKGLGEWSIDLRIKHRKTDDVKWVRAGGRAHRGSNGDTVWNGLLLDISERHKAEEALRVSEERLRRILGTSPIAIGISDVRNFKLMFANKRLGEMFHIPKKELIGYDTRKFYESAKQHRRHWVETRRNHNLQNQETHCRRADDSLFWAEITTRLIEYGGRQAILWWAFDITEHKHTKEALAHLAHHDALTGLANRRLFEDHLQNAVSLASRTGRAGVLFYFDLDGFKAVNDKHGHGFGDWVLDQVGVRLRNVLRDSDIGARLGGDEFAVIAHGIEDFNAIEAVIDKMQNAISAPYEKDGKTAAIGLSIGVVRFFGHEDDIKKLVMVADAAMYDAKQAGKGTYRLINMPSNDSGKALS